MFDGSNPERTMYFFMNLHSTIINALGMDIALGTTGHKIGHNSAIQVNTN